MYCIALKGDWRDMYCVLSKKDWKKCAKFQSENFQYVCLFLYSSVADNISYTKRNENDV
jgi:hypothetical protein